MKAPAMSQFSTLLFQLIHGKTTLAVVRDWLAGKLKQSTIDRNALLVEIDAALRAGLLMPMARSLRKQIEAARAVENAEKTELLLAKNDASSETATTQPTSPQSSGPEGTSNIVMWSDGERALHRSDDAREASFIRVLEDGTTQLNHSVSTDERTVAEATAQSWRTGSNLTGDESEPRRTIGVGSVLKQRFELVAPIGEGGMGTVYKARDLLKVEARDRNPYIAVKLLSGDFRQHPEAFIALQREASKAQRLAHPNIATVYDFDRDGHTVYMTMELMEGEELAKHIKQLPAGGLPVPAAMTLIQQLCSGLSYAHKSALVHADFKPSNAFLNHDGRVKLLDFGIARASKLRHDNSEGEAETTVFDPVSLGALTPAYATIEMFEGNNPDPRDDIYALACVAYELLSSKHPFDKLSAVKVKEKNLKPKPLSKLTKKQNRALLSALARERATRTATVDQFWDGLRPRKNHTWRFVAIGALIAVVVAGLAFGPASIYLKRQQTQTLVNTIRRGDRPLIAAVLEKLKTLEPSARRGVLDSAKDSLINYFETRAEAAVNADKGRYDFPEALDAMRRAQHFYPDSAQVLNIQTSLKTRRSELVNRLTKTFNAELKAGRIMPVEGKDITDVISKLAAASPHSPLLHDPRLANRYADLAQQAMNNNDIQRAEQALQSGLAYNPADPALQNLADQLHQQQKKAAAARHVAALEKELGATRSRLATMPDYEAIRRDLAKLGMLDPENAVLKHIEKPLRNEVRATLHNDIETHGWKRADVTLLNFAPFFSISELLQSRARLSDAEIAAGYQPPSVRQRLAKIDSRHHMISQLLAKPQFSASWRGRLLTNFKQLIALKQLGDTWFEPLRAKISQTYITRAKRMLKQKRFNATRRLLEHAQPFDTGHSALAATRHALTSAREKFQRGQAERLETARIGALKNQLATQSDAGEVGNARHTLSTLATQLPPDSPYILRTGPAVIARGYLRLAKARARNGDYRGALTLVNAGLTLAPSLGELKRARTEFNQQAQRAALLKRAGSLAANRMPALKREFDTWTKRFPQDSKALEKALLERLAVRIRHLSSVNARRAHHLLNAARQAFPANRLLNDIKLRKLTRHNNVNEPLRPARDGSRPCTRPLAGYGRKGRAECFDMLATGVPGPILVVVPSGQGFKAPFAIGKYEVSIGQYNRYCRQTPGCTALADDPRLPATGLSFKRAAGYVAWLSAQTNHHYTIPTHAQWLYAARANNPGAVSDFNCRVTLGDQTLKGLSLVEIETGKANAWGLVNYVGNAQEWVDGAKGHETMGGDYQDSLAKCSITLARHDEGDDDEVTGLRVVREIK